MAKPKYRIGQKVIATDPWAVVHGRKPEGEGVGVIRDLFAPHGRHTPKKDKTAPYYVELEDGSASWYEEEALAPAPKTRAKKSSQKPKVDMYWVEQGRRWAREDVAKPSKLARIQKLGAKFDAEAMASDYLMEVQPAEEIEAMEGWIEARYGYRTELEKLTGLKFFSLTDDLIKDA